MKKWKFAAGGVLALGLWNGQAAAQAPSNAVPIEVVQSKPQVHPAVTGTAVSPLVVAPGSTLEAAGCSGCASDCGERWYLFPQDHVSVRGWIEGGYMGNPQNPKSRFNGPYNAIDRDEGMFNQAYLIAEKKLGDDCGIGGRMDLLYGFDYILAQSLGFELTRDGESRWNSSEYYGLAMPQLYAEVGNKDLSVKVGRFYSIVGFEGVMSSDNFFYLRSYSYMFAGPFTHWGALGTWNADSNWSIQAGIVNGWNALDREHNDPAFLGGIKYTADNNHFWTSFAIVTGDEFTNVAGLPDVEDGFANRTRYSFIVDANPGGQLEYIFHQWLGLQEEGAPDGGTALWYGIDQYLLYRYSCQLAPGFRFEWFRDEDGTRVGLNRPSNPNKPPLPGNYYSATLGLNYTPCQNVLIRPELRWDWYDGPAHPYDDGDKDNQFLLGLDVVLRF